ncbi:MAG TPA: ABC transporter ATP-binding protein [Anaeromyxobacter sp.]|nr:ABC transporter ATP-binding protein [Anaeromyxobacter sp.]
MERALSFEIIRRYRRGPTVAASASWPLSKQPLTVLFGPSGSGKTTVLRALAGLDRPDEGTIAFAGETWFDGARKVFVPPQARGVGLLFQEGAVFPHLSVEGNVGYGLGRLGRNERAARVNELAGWLRIAHLMRRRPAELSGGERQRVALARALAPRPRLLLLDEPLSALDAPTREALRAELRSLLERSGVPAVVVTHDRAEALALGDRLAVLVNGTIKQVGPVQEVFSSPADVEVALVVGTENVLSARRVGGGDGLVKLRAGTADLVAVDPGGVEDEAFACVRAEDVVLEPDDGGHLTSAQNRLPGSVASRRDEGPLVRVFVECGVRLVALVTRQSAERLSLLPGRRVVASFKAQAVRIVPRPS